MRGGSKSNDKTESAPTLKVKRTGSSIEVIFDKSRRNWNSDFSLKRKSRDVELKVRTSGTSTHEFFLRASTFPTIGADSFSSIKDTTEIFPA